MWLRMPTDLLKLFTASVVAIFLAIPYLKAKTNNSFVFANKGVAQKNA
jgi:putative ABC transport system permease protein